MTRICYNCINTKGTTVKKREIFLYQNIAESLRRRIASGELQPGDKLPSVRSTARRWGCAPGTVSRAYAQLAQEGLAEGHRGGGTRVTSSTLQPQHPVWGWATLINRAEQFLLEALGSGHTPSQAESALSVAAARWRDTQRQGTPQSGREPAVVAAELEPAPGPGFRFAGSHDLTVEVLARMSSEEASEAYLSIEYTGSLGGLMALSRGEVQVAGSHLWDEASDTYNIPFVQRLLPGRQLVLLTLVQRSLGLIVPAGNPQRLRGITDLTQPDVRIVNRQPGSGTRVWLDAQLKAAGVASESISGYDQQELTHLAVARTVYQGVATVGLGICAAASAYGLGFVPLTWERYDLVFPAESWSLPMAGQLAAIIRSCKFAEAVAALGGYDTSETGKETVIA